MSEQCPICLETFSEKSTKVGEQKYELPCHHCFHTDCVMELFRRGDSKCPLCRDVPENCQSEEETLGRMESIARLEWKRHNDLRNRWARRDSEVCAVRDQFWEARNTVRKLGNEYNRDFQKAMRASIRDVNREFREKRNAMQRALQNMYDADMAFDKAIEKKKQK